MPTDETILDFSGLLAAFQDGIILTYPVGPNRRGIIEIDGPAEVVRIRWPAAEAESALRRYRNLSIQKATRGQSEDLAVLEVDASKSHSAAISFATSVVTALAGNQTVLSTSVLQAISGWNDIIDEFQLLSRSKQVGLLGELLFLLHLVDGLGPDKALSCWLGPPRSEHDFALEEFEVEVKTTESERRIHRVSSETQLTESVGRRLFVLSIQLTSGGGSSRSFSLSDVVAKVRGVMIDHRQAVDSRLEEAGWEDQFSELYNEKFMYRTAPKLYAVDQHFPRITRDVLDKNLERGELVTRVSYRIDLSAIPETDPPELVVGFGDEDD